MARDRARMVPLLSLLFTGHMVDLPDRAAPRFPPALVEPARRELDRRIARHVLNAAGGRVHGFASLARGGDILFHEICRAAGIATTIILPFAQALFLETSVNGVESGAWPARFRHLWDTTPPERRHDLGLPVGDQAYVKCNEQMLGLAEAAGAVQLIAIFDRSAEARLGGAASFVLRVRTSSGREPDIIDTRDLATDSGV